MTFTPTQEQLDAVHLATASTDNLIIEARAGAAKTSTLVLIARALLERDTPALLSVRGWTQLEPDLWQAPKGGAELSLAEAFSTAGLPATMRCLAFNKANADEMALRLPPNCVSQTLNSLGHRAWGEFLGKHLRLDKGKSYSLLKDEIAKLDARDRTEINEQFSETLQAISEGKTRGWIPEHCQGYWKPLVTDDEFFEGLDFEPTELQYHLIRAVSIHSWQKTLKGEIDFDDQILTAATCPVTFFHYPLVLIDEAQDLSPINHVILGKLCKRARLIAVGDPCQAIYGFRGAADDSMDRIAAQFRCKTTYLTTTFRCAKSIVESVHWRAPDMQAASWAPEGVVKSFSTWSLSDILDGDTILCRTNAPLFSLALTMIAHGRLPELPGRDFTKGVITALRKLGKPSATQPEVLDAIARWEEKELKRARRKGPVYDKAECLRIFARNGETLEEACTTAEEVLNREGRILLMTGHRSKGAEWDRVFILNKSEIRMKDQDPNILYVMQTRPRHFLGFIERKEME